jgi:toxic protein SymE
MAEQKTKKVKLQPEHRKLAYREKIAPVLHLSGVWLEEIGFKAGGQVMITIEQNQLIIKPL